MDSGGFLDGNPVDNSEGLPEETSCTLIGKSGGISREISKKFPGEIIVGILGGISEKIQSGNLSGNLKTQKKFLDELVK